MRRNEFLPEKLYDYLCNIALRETSLQQELREETQRLLPDEARMQIGPDQGQFMQLLVHLSNARRCLEVGVFTGYSALSVALALPEDGTIVACDVSEQYTAMARRYWKSAGVAEKIQLRIAPAIQTLDDLLASGAQGTFDFAFIDADKPSYDGYYERCLLLLRQNGLIAIDNVFWSGRVADPNEKDSNTEALRTLNAKIGRDERVDVAMVAVGDGVTLVRKR
ncbi:MAG: class I SAM-dependent methyltransferase [Candidatus Eremiobacteraeota bacterium]|nr:class I SAM-dependent methyltransferase [Candidatus Eremiobacteraeota bacterium]